MMSNEGLDLSWLDVCRHQTPRHLARLVGQLAVCELLSLKEIKAGEYINVVDLFSGDGRLGLAVRESLRYPCRIEFVEIDQRSVIFPLSEQDEVVRASAFTYAPDREVDLVVMNPPYLRLRKASAKQFGLEWSKLRDKGENLYSLAILTALDHLRTGGVLVALAPFGWILGPSFRGFREHLRKLCTSVRLRTVPSLREFSGVTQAVGVQVFVKRADHGTRARYQSRWIRWRVKRLAI